MKNSKVLNGLRVLEQGAFITGPYAAMLLGDLGADVIKLERPDGGDPFRNFAGGLYSPHFQAYNRNKRSITLDNREPQDLKTFDALIATADVFIQNFRPGVAERLGAGPDRLMQMNPKLIYCSISGFGSTGPYVDRPSYDTVAQALSGFLNMQLDPAKPRIAGPALADAVTGLYASHAILGAVHERHATGKGRLVEVSMLEAMAHFSIEPYSNYFASGRTPGAYGRASVSQSYVLRCADNCLIALHLSSPEKFWTNLLSAIEKPEIGMDPRFSTRSLRIENHALLSDELDHAFLARPRSEWLARLIPLDVPCAPVNDLDETLADPQAQHLQLEIRTQHPTQGEITTIRPAPVFDGERSLSFLPPPTLGEHGDEIRKELNLL